MRLGNFKTNVVIVATAVALITGAAKAENIEWSAGSTGGSWFTVVTGLASIVMENNEGLNIRIVPGGGKDNPMKIRAGVSQIAMGIDFLAASAMKGTEPYDTAATNLTSLGSTWMTSQIHIIVDAEETRTADQIFADPSIKVGTSSPATSEALTLRRILAFYENPVDNVKAEGGTVVNADYSQLVAAFQNKQVDVLFGAGTAPTGIAMEVEAGRRAAKIIPFPKELMDGLFEQYGYGSYNIPAGTYKQLQAGNDADVEASALSTVILADAGLDEELVYDIMMSLLQNQDKFGNISGALSNFDPNIAWENQPVPLHPGAARAYKELGYMN